MKKLLACGLTAFSLSFSLQAETLRIYNWIEYIPTDVVEDFSKESGIQVIYDVFDSNEQMETKILTGNSGYDLTFPGSASLKRLIDSGSLQALDLSQLSHYNNLTEESLANLRMIGDSKNQYAVPFMTGTNIIGYNPDMVEKVLGKRDLESWDDLLQVDSLKKLSECGVAFMDSPSEVMPIFLSYLGLPHDSTSKADYNKVGKFAKELRPYIRYFNSSQYVTDMVNGDICVALGWSGSFNLAQIISDVSGAGTVIHMVLPKQGAPVWYDSMVIPKGAPNPAAAHQFIDFILRPEIIARITNSVGYPNPNKKSLPYIAEEIRNNPALNISKEMQDKLYPLMPISLRAERNRTRAWTNFKNNR